MAKCLFFSSLFVEPEKYFTKECSQSDDDFFSSCCQLCFFSLTIFSTKSRRFYMLIKIYFIKFTFIGPEMTKKGLRIIPKKWLHLNLVPLKFYFREVFSKTPYKSSVFPKEKKIQCVQKSISYMSSWTWPHVTWDIDAYEICCERCLSS